MSLKRTLKPLALGVLPLLLLGAMDSASAGSTVWLDDLETPGTSRLGTQWRGFTDRVMGGRSDMEVDVAGEEANRHYRMRGIVRTENNGGFIQIALPLQSASGQPMNAGEFSGVRLRVRGNGEEYAVHLRTTDCRAPWNYYSATFETTEAWQDITLSFEDFKPTRFRTPLNTKKLSRIALVGIGRDFQAELHVSRIGWVK